MAAVTISQRVAEFVPKAKTRVRELTLELKDVFDYEGYQSDRSEELLLMITETNDFIRLLSYDNYGELTEKEINDAIDFFNKWLELHKVIAANYENYFMPIAPNVVVSPGNYALAMDLAAETAARILADASLDARVDALETGGIDPGAVFPDGFFDNHNSTYAVVFDDDARLHTHANKPSLDELNADDISRIKALLAHYQSVGEPGGLHVNQADRDLWNAGGGGGGSTVIKQQNFTAPGGTSSFLVTIGVVNQLILVVANTAVQTIGVDVSLAGNAVEFGTNVPAGVKISVIFAEGLSLSEGGGSDVYNLTSPSTVAVGGTPAGTPLTGRTWQSIVEEDHCDYLLPVLSAFGSSDIPPLIEVGTVLSGVKSFTYSVTNPGNIEPGTMAIRDVTSNTLIISGQPQSSPIAADIGTITNTVPMTRAWRAEGENTEGDIFVSAQKVVNSGYPWFYGKVASGGAIPGASRPVANQALINSGTKVVASSTGDLSVTFGSTSDDYIWFAIPLSSTSKLSWFIDALNNGPIGGAVGAGGNLFPAFDTVSINSPTALWSGVQYKIYVSNYQTAVAVAMQLRNAA